MESLLHKMRGPEYSETENEKVMSRLQWLNHLSLIFNLTSNIASIVPISHSITTEAFLNTLIENIQSLPLLPFSVYNTSTSIKSFSFAEIFSCFENDFGKLINWDYIMEKIMNHQENKKTHRRKDSPSSIDLNELVFISKHTSSSVDYDYEVEKSRKIGDLRIPQTPGLETGSFQALSGQFTPSPRNSQDYSGFDSKYSLKVPDFRDSIRSFVLSKDSDKTIKLNLSCKKISILTTKLPLTLIELNLSHNRLTRMPNVEDLERLEYLNLS